MLARETPRERTAHIRRPWEEAYERHEQERQDRRSEEAEFEGMQLLVRKIVAAAAAVEDRKNTLGRDLDFFNSS